MGTRCYWGNAARPGCSGKRPPSCSGSPTPGCNVPPSSCNVRNNCYLLSWFGIFEVLLVQNYRIPPTPGCNVPSSSCYIRNSCKLLFNLLWQVSSKSYLKYYQSKFIGFQSLNWNSTLKCYYLLVFEVNQLHFKCSYKAVVVGYHLHCIVL